MKNQPTNKPLYKIENNVPLTKKYRGIELSNYPWDKMKIGDSFVVEPGNRKTTSVQTQLATNARMWAAYNKKAVRFVTRKEGNNIRVWRVQ